VIYNRIVQCNAGPYVCQPNVLEQGNKMKLGKMKLFSIAFAAAAVVATLALASAVHKKPAPIEQGYDVNPVVGPDGDVIGAAANPSMRSHFERDGLPE
jgi:hypothetical protein